MLSECLLTFMPGQRAMLKRIYSVISNSMLNQPNRLPMYLHMQNIMGCALVNLLVGREREYVGFEL